MATGPKEVRKEDEDQATLPEVHRREETNRAKVHHLRPVQSGANLRPVSVELGREGMCEDNLPLNLADKNHTITADNGKEFARPYHSWGAQTRT